VVQLGLDFHARPDGVLYYSVILLAAHFMCAPSVVVGVWVAWAPRSRCLTSQLQGLPVEGRPSRQRLCKFAAQADLGYRPKLYQLHSGCLQERRCHVAQLLDRVTTSGHP
jgi:hypothetical protein